MSENPLYIQLINVHGLVRGGDLELGRDPDTGGQTLYVVELARALADHPHIERVDIVTRKIEDSDVDQDYAQPFEELSAKARIVRLEAGPEGYIHKEMLWDYLDNFADNLLAYIREQERVPDLLHSHYADAGHVGVRLSHVLGVPLVHTGHSLGRVKRRRLLAGGLKRDEIEDHYNMSRRIEAEEETLANVDLLVTSTRNEVEEQYELYDFYQPDYMAVIPPGTDLSRFHEPSGGEWDTPVAAEIARFLTQPRKPMIFTLSRADERKNLAMLVTAYGESVELQQSANLVIVAGTRDDIRDMDAGAQRVLKELLLLIDQYDLYGKIAYPKRLASEDVPVLYRLAAASRGVFVNPALTEPFGLTLIEAAASGLPIVATEDGGPQEIVENCQNGFLVDPLDVGSITQALRNILSDEDQWQRLAGNGVKGTHRHYSWDAHVESYIRQVQPIVERTEPPPRTPISRRPMLYHDRAVFTDLDQNLLGDPNSLKRFGEFIRNNRKCASFGIATGRGLEAALSVIRQYSIPQPDVLITNLGTEIYYAPQLTADLAWARHIDHPWNPNVIRRILDPLPGLEYQPKAQQSQFKISYFIDSETAPTLEEINRLLHQEEESVTTILSFGQFLDVLPVRASKGLALRYFADQFDIPLDHILVAGGSGADEDMMLGNTLAVVVANRHHEELSQLTDVDRIYFAEKPFASGILEAIEQYDFYGECRVPDTT